MQNRCIDSVIVHFTFFSCLRLRSYCITHIQFCTSHEAEISLPYANSRVVPADPFLRIITHFEISIFCSHIWQWVCEWCSFIDNRTKTEFFLSWMCCLLSKDIPGQKPCGTPGKGYSVLNLWSFLNIMHRCHEGNMSIERFSKSEQRHSTFFRSAFSPWKRANALVLLLSARHLSVLNSSAI